LITNRVKNSKIYAELKDSVLLDDFHHSRDKFIHNVDSLYYMVNVTNGTDNQTYQNMIEILETMTGVAQDSNDIIKLSQFDKSFDDNIIVRPFGVAMYQYCLDSVNQYSVFIARKAKSNPEIWVQIRSEFLWLYGEHDCVRMSLNTIEKFLSCFGLDIQNVKENRIDYAYHTNYIQDPLNFFKEKNLNSMQVSNFKRYSLEGCFIGSDEVEKDYVTFGRKKSNNIFFRVYNKTKEVIEKGYKQFFIEIWHKNKMISSYDKYCIEKAFHKSNYRYLDSARLLYYIEFGIDDSLKKIMQNAIDSEDQLRIRECANLYMPKITLVCNIEIETKRKFYYSLDESSHMFLKLKSKCKPYAKNIFRIIDNKESFHKLLTHDVIRFIDRSSSERKTRCVTASWWKRLQQVKVNRKYKQNDINLYRTYQTEHDIQLIRNRTLKSVASYSVYRNGDNSFDKNFHNDIMDIMSTLTENEIQDLHSYKRKKFALESNKIEHIEQIEACSRYVVLDKTTGEYL